MALVRRNGKWHYRFQVAGSPYSANTGLADTERKRNAALRIEAKARELAEAGRGHLLRIEVRPFNEAAADFLEWADGEHADHPNTAKRLRTSFASLCAFFRAAPVAGILRGHVNDYKAWRRKHGGGVKEITIRHDLHALSKAFGYFIDHNWARENAVKGVEIPSDRDAVRIYVLPEAEEFVYFAAAERFPALHDLGRLMLNQGCRPDEVLELQVPDVDLERSTVTIRAGKSKAAKRTLRLTPESREILSRRIQEVGGASCGSLDSPAPTHAVGDGHAQASSKRSWQLGNVADPSAQLDRPLRCAARQQSLWLFPGKAPGKRLVKVNAQHWKVLALTSLSFVIYDFRHTAATRWSEAGVDIATIATWLGHADLRTVQKYVHVQKAHSDAMAERAERYMAERRKQVETEEPEIRGRVN